MSSATATASSSSRSCCITSERLISPAGFERFFRELSDLTAVGAPDPATIAELAGRYELPFAEPDWLPNVITRYGLTPPKR